MFALLLRRLTHVVLMLVCMVILTPLFLKVVPGAKCPGLPDTASPETVAACEKSQLPWPTIALNNCKTLMRGDLGQSSWSHQPVLGELTVRIFPTFQLAFVSFALSLWIGVTAGIVAANGRYTFSGQLLNGVGMSLMALPILVVGITLQKFFVLYLHWLIILQKGWQGLILPVLAMTIPLSAYIMRLTRNAFIQTLQEKYLLTARAKGGNQWIVLRHALPNTLIALVPIWGSLLRRLLDGAILIEAIFQRAGLGQYMLDALIHKDYTAFQGGVLFLTVCTAVINLASDLCQIYLNPQTRSDLLNR